MRKNSILYILALTGMFTSCRNGAADHDATGSFEATEILVSSEIPGKILTLNINEGDQLKAGQVAGSIDALPVDLQRLQAEASLNAIGQKTIDPNPQIAILTEQKDAQSRQIAVQEEQIAAISREKDRVGRMLQAKAATQKQWDDVSSQLDVARKQLDALKAQQNVIAQQIISQKQAAEIQNKGILSERQPMQQRVAQLSDQAKRANIVNPIDGIVLVKYANAGEVTGAGKTLYKIADMDTMVLRAYITGNQLSSIKLGQQVQVLTDGNKSAPLTGKISWVSSKAEFTPKSIQTKDERANLVYAIKIRVKNDGTLKIGMPADVKF